jgi:PAS domain S-box-containing protein
MPTIDGFGDPYAFLSGGGEMGQRMRAHDWAATSLGPLADWPQSLKTMVSTCLNSPVLATVLWGPDLIMLYNDAYIPSLADRHPNAMATPVAYVWGSAWEQVCAPFHHCQRTGEGFSQAEVELPMIRRGKSETTYWNFSAAPIRGENGLIVGLFNQGTEITEAIRQERERARIEAQLQTLNETLEQQVQQRTLELNQLWHTSPDLLLVIDFHGVFIRVNPSWTALLGYLPDELVGHHVNEFVVEDDHDDTVDAYVLAAEGGMPRVVNRYRHKDGSLRWFSWVAAPAGDVTYATGRDVTLEKQQAQALTRAEEALRQSQKLEAIGQLTGGVAHDFNNLLTVIKSSVDMLKKPDLPDTRRQRYVGAISDTVDRAAKLTSQLLSFARRQALKPEVFAACNTVRSLSGMIETLTGSLIQIVTQLPEDPCFVRADVSQYETALINMVVNARDAMGGEGQLAIRVQTIERIPALQGQAAIDGPYVQVSIIDTGVGIPQDQLAKVFEPFFTTKRPGQGTGLGLSQVFGFAKQSGGEVTVQSSTEHGSTFNLYLPKVEAPAPAVSQEEEEALVYGHGTCVLVVEDNVQVGNVAVQSLIDRGYFPVLANNAEQALAELAADADRFDVVFSDVMMPGMNGIDLARKIREEHHDLPVLLTSGYSHALAENGTFGFELLHKPYSIEQLSRRLCKVANCKRRQRILGT